MDVVVEEHQICCASKQADQQATNVVLVVSNGLSGGSEDVVELEQYENQNERTGYDCKTNIAQTLRQTGSVVVPGAIVICELAK